MQILTRCELIAAEHRRWVTEKICDGWISMSVEDSLPYNDTKDALGKCDNREEKGYD